MEKQKLLRTIEQLRKELSQAESVDPATLDELESLTDELRRALDGESDTREGELEPVSGLKSLLLRYEAEHPQLSDAVGRVADALAAIGL